MQNIKQITCWVKEACDLWFKTSCFYIAKRLFSSALDYICKLLKNGRQDMWDLRQEQETFSGY